MKWKKSRSTKYLCTCYILSSFKFICTFFRFWAKLKMYTHFTSSESRHYANIRIKDHIKQTRCFRVTNHINSTNRIKKRNAKKTRTNVCSLLLYKFESNGQKTVRAFTNRKKKCEWTKSIVRCSCNRLFCVFSAQTDFFSLFAWSQRTFLKETSDKHRCTNEFYVCH